MIAAQGLTKFYGETCAIRDLDFTIEQGEIVGILGLNGAGKSTTLRILSCLLLPSSGTVRIKDRDIVEHPHETRKLVGFLPETPPLYEEMTVSGFLVFAGEIRGMRQRQAESKLDEILELVDIADVRDSTISSLSHGYRQRVGIAQALIHEPPVVILDEPISGLDPAQIKEMRRVVRSLGGNHTVLVSSHILSEISQTCDRILVIHDGELVASGTEEDLAVQTDSQRQQITVRGDPKKVTAAIGRLDGVVSCTNVGQAEGAPYRGEAKGLVNHFQVDTNGDRRERIAQAIIEGGFGLLQLTPAEPELESAFLELTRRARDEGGAKPTERQVKAEADKADDKKAEKADKAEADHKKAEKADKAEASKADDKKADDKKAKDKASAKDDGEEDKG